MCGLWFGSWGMFPGMLIPLLILAAVIYLCRGAGCYRGSSPLERRYANGENPLDILKCRFAKGEITQEDFDRMKREVEQ